MTISQVSPASLVLSAREEGWEGGNRQIEMNPESLQNHNEVAALGETAPRQAGLTAGQTADRCVWTVKGRTWADADGRYGNPAPCKFCKRLVKD